MATFRTYDRLIYAKVETTEGTSDSPGTDDYIETIEPTFNITNRVYDRNVTRKSISPMLKTVTGTGAGTGQPSAMCEFTFGVELAGTGLFDSPATWATIPQWARLLEACGLERTTMWRAPLKTTLSDGGSAARVPRIMRNRSWISNQTSGAGSAFYEVAAIGRLIGDLHFDDPYVYIAEMSGTTPAPGADSDKYFSQAANQHIANCDPYATVSDALVKMGYAWTPISNEQLGGSGAANTSSLTINLQLGLGGQYISASGCRGNVEFAFTAGDKCVMNFTFQGKLTQYRDAASSALPDTVTQAVPPSVVGISASLGESGFGTADAADVTGSVFNNFSLDLGNELALREDVNDTVGYEATYITGRTGSMTIDPDARPSTDSGQTPWFSNLLSGDPSRLRIALGNAAQDDANSFVFKMPALQFEQVADGERENVMTYDITGAMTGGDNGSSVQEDFTVTTAPTASVGSAILNTRIGTNNEFALFYS